LDNNEPIRVLCVLATLNRGGAETMCMNIYRAIDKSKVQFDFVKHYPDKGAYEDEVESLGGKIYCAPTYKFYNHFQYVSWWKQFLQDHPEYKIIHGHYYTISAIYFKVAKKYGLKTIAHSHNSNESRGKLDGIIRNYLISKINNYSDYRFACSIDAGKWIFKNRPFTVINNAIDASLYRYNQETRTVVRKELGLNDGLVIGTVGGYRAQKNPQGIIEIFKEVHKLNPNSKFVWVGDGELREQIQRQIKESGLQECFLLLGVRSDVDRILQAIDVFIMPSLYEGLSVAAIEAQASGTQSVFSTTISSDVKITEFVHFVDLDNYQLWAKTITELNIDKHDSYLSIVNAGYDINENAKSIQQFYCNCVAPSYGWNSITPLITILTPSYNRQNELVKLYDSLEKQSSKNFQWLVIDDGSSDDTESYIASLQQVSSFKIEYIKKINGGKHSALNIGFKTIKTPLTFIVDSDDILLQNAIAEIEKYSTAVFNNNLAGISFLRGYSENEVIGDKFHNTEYVDNYINYNIRRGISGDKAEVWRTDILSRYQFPCFENERFQGENYVWVQISEDYDLLCVNKIIYVTEYLDGGLTQSGRPLRISCPLGGMENCRVYFNGKYPLKERMKRSILYVTYGFFAGYSPKIIIKTSFGYLGVIVSLPFGYGLYRFWDKKYGKQKESTYTMF